MTKAEAAKIPDLQIHPNDIVEDCFFYKLAKMGKLSNEQGENALKRLREKKNDPLYQGAFIVADMMIENLKKYGVACIDWCE